MLSYAKNNQGHYLNQDYYVDILRKVSIKLYSEVSDEQTYAQVSIDACVTSSSRQVFVFSVGYVLVSLCISVLLGKAEVNDVDKVTLLS